MQKIVLKAKNIFKGVLLELYKKVGEPLGVQTMKIGAKYIYSDNL